MEVFTRLTCVGLAIAFIGITVAAAQQAPAGCSSDHPANAPQTLHCPGDLTIVAEDGAKFTLQSLDKKGGVESINLQSRALLVDAPKQRGKRRFHVSTPQAIAAVRGTKWAVDAQETRTSVLVLSGQVAVRRPGGAEQAVLGPGDGVDVESGSAALVIKRWPQPRVDALLARLGQ